MIGIIGLSALFIVLGLSLVITRVATVSLMFTGLSVEVARFQARSVFTGTGFTTDEAESVMNHPVRRRIIMALMLLRSAGVITIVLSLILSFIGTDDPGRLVRLAWLTGGALLLWMISKSGTFDRAVKYAMTRLVKPNTDIQIIDYTQLLKLSGDYVIREMLVHDQDWIANRKLQDCQLRDEGLTVIGIHRANGSYVGVPHGDTDIYPGDRMVLYGQGDDLKNLDLRRKGPAGDRAHHDAVGNENRRMEKQKTAEQEYESERKGR